MFFLRRLISIVKLLIQLSILLLPLFRFIGRTKPYKKFSKKFIETETPHTFEGALKALKENRATKIARKNSDFHLQKILSHGKEEIVKIYKGSDTPIHVYQLSEDDLQSEDWEIFS